MNKPDQSDINTCREVLEYLLHDMYENEPYARNTIDDFESVLGNIPDEGDL